VVSAAAQQSDRWQVIASLVVFGVSAAAVMRYFVRQHETLITGHNEARKEPEDALRGMVTEQVAGAAKLAVSLDAHKRVLEDYRDGLRRLREARRLLASRGTDGAERQPAGSRQQHPKQVARADVQSEFPTQVQSSGKRG